MRILHIASITDDSCSGVCVVVPQHVLAQSKYAVLGFVNTNGTVIPSLADFQLPCPLPLSISSVYSAFGRPDLVVFHECYRPAYLPIARQLRREKIPYVIIPHGELSQDAQKKKHLKKTAANLLLFNRFTRQAVAIQCLSQRELEQTYFGRQKFIGTNGVFLPALGKSAFSPSGTRFVYIGRLDAFHKGLDLMLEAVRLCAPFLREHGCTLALYGPDYAGRFAHVQELIRQNGIEDLTTLSPAISGQEKEDTLLGADVFVQTSRFEGMPLGILEALSYGIPCLA
ncbi:MAG: glycosyltransferase, partial [Oscillospiraceae bacterium]|nr:glycosyltransferase [Oscillospiraceae bacterium]